MILTGYNRVLIVWIWRFRVLMVIATCYSWNFKNLITPLESLYVKTYILVLTEVENVKNWLRYRNNKIFGVRHNSMFFDRRQPS